MVENLLREIDGKTALPGYDGHSNCFIESGYHKALLIDFNWDMEPLEGSFPLPCAGPFSPLEETHMNHVGKLAFKWVYRNMLLPGRLPSVALLPSHMSFLGKDLTSTPQVRHTREMHVGDVMTRDPVTVRQGTANATTSTFSPFAPKVSRSASMSARVTDSACRRSPPTSASAAHSGVIPTIWNSGTEP